MKKFFTQILTVIAFIVILVGLLIAGLDSKDAPAVIMLVAFTAPFLAAALATAFVFAKNDTVKNVGYILSALVGVYGVLMLLADKNFMIVAIGMILMLVPSVIYVFIQLFALLGFVRAKDLQVSKSDDMAALLNQYKALEKEAILSAEEFDALKAKVLKNTDTQGTTLDDLKKWKKLLDQQVITEEEFTNLKAQSFSK
jgi:hypothetical protein